MILQVANKHGTRSIAGDVRPAEPHDAWEARVAEYSHDNLFAGIYSRGEDQGSSSGGNDQAGADLDDLEAIMAASQPPAGQGDAAQAEPPSTTVGSKSE
ncbi:hypothetical protein BHE90_008110 [Fusarium euwallaceae]|uniref:Uncharacterized protein n=1 Tax=Fusarium euwallaceae TaxID=1147111 RepID=A0A430LP07_9HYPO|nr:hypothetical protein BHE90_008110 [Fusarium euwallaceae]